MASTIGTARGSTHGSWRPCASSLAARPARSTVSCARRIVAVGLKATRTTTSSPLLMPPCTPPERLLRVRGRQRHQRAREVRLELVEDGLAEAGGDAARHALDYAAQRVAAPARGVDA